MSSAFQGNKPVLLEGFRQYLTCAHCISGTYQGQWLRGLRHGYGVRTSAAYGVATHFRGQHGNMRGSESSLNQTAGNPMGNKTIGAAGAAGAAGAGGSTAGDETRGGFVLRTRSDPIPHRRRSLVERSGMKSFVQVCICRYLYTDQLKGLY